MLGSRRWLLCAAAVALGGCLSSPTLPLPPPAPEQPTVPVDGQTRIAGTVPVRDLGVRVLALNSRTHRIFGESTEIRQFSFLAEAQSGDVFVLWYTVGDEQSEPVELTVPYPIGSPPSPDEDAGCTNCADAAPGDQ